MDRIIDKQSAETEEAMAIIAQSISASLVALQQLQLNHKREMAEVRSFVKTSLGTISST